MTGYHTQLILSGRRINDGMGEWIAKEIILEITSKGIPIKNEEFLIMGFTFKENCPDIRNTKVLDIINTLLKYNVRITVVDPLINKKEIESQLDISVLNKLPNKKDISLF